MDSDIYIYCVDSVLVDVCMTIYNHIFYIYVAWLDISEVLAILIWGNMRRSTRQGLRVVLDPRSLGGRHFLLLVGLPKDSQLRKHILMN